MRMLIALFVLTAVQTGNSIAAEPSEATTPPNIIFT
jgi:hypothetical protein